MREKERYSDGVKQTRTQYEDREKENERERERVDRVRGKERSFVRKLFLQYQSSDRFARYVYTAFFAHLFTSLQFC